MYCTSCKPIVEKQLENEQAVKKIDIDYMTDSVIVEFDPSLITRQEIKYRLEKSGYKFVRTSDKLNEIVAPLPSVLFSAHIFPP